MQADPIEYNNINLKILQAIIEESSSCFGGDDLFEPLMSISHSMKSPGSSLKRILIVTDGGVNKMHQTTLLMNQICQDNEVKVSTIGVGRSCKRSLLANLAKAGQGSHSVIPDFDQNKISLSMIDALLKFQEVTMEGCSLSYV